MAWSARGRHRVELDDAGKLFAATVIALPGFFRFLCWGLLAACGVSASTISAQDYPNRPIRVVLPYGVGGSADVLARVIAPGALNYGSVGNGSGKCANA